ncbi:MAG: hypothetical protein HY512_02905 [Candidatus Aenigmarchaeota archaeon]|nr:hypothetical protein [Candidatus Aenigmarchaeota archaeon]
MERIIDLENVERWKQGSLGLARQMVDEAQAINNRAAGSKGVKLPFNPGAFDYFSDALFDVIPLSARRKDFAERDFDWDNGEIRIGVYQNNRTCSWLVPRKYFEIWNQSGMDGEFGRAHLFGNGFAQYDDERTAVAKRREQLEEALVRKVEKADLVLSDIKKQERDNIRVYKEKMDKGKMEEMEYFAKVNISARKIREQRAILLADCREAEAQVNRLIEGDERKLANLKDYLQKFVCENERCVGDMERERLAAYRGITDTRWSLYSSMLGYKRAIRERGQGVGKEMQKLGREVSRVFGFLTSWGAAKDTAQVVYGPVGARVNDVYRKIGV